MDRKTAITVAAIIVLIFCLFCTQFASKFPSQMQGFDFIRMIGLLSMTTIFLPSYILGVVAAGDYLDYNVFIINAIIDTAIYICIIFRFYYLSERYEKKKKQK